MQEWPSQVEDILRETGIPTADFECDVATYVDIICALLDVPVHKSRIQSLHVFFSLFSAFKHSQHFNQLAQEDNNNLDLDDSQQMMFWKKYVYLCCFIVLNKNKLDLLWKINSMYV